MSPWLIDWTPARDAEALRLYCFPFAGGSAAAFRPWAPLLPATIGLTAVQLPGHGNRLRERPIDRLEDLVSATVEAIRDASEGPCALFGHSMGAILASETARAMIAEGLPPPVMLFVSGRRPATMPDRDPPLAVLTDVEFVAEVQRRYDGIPAEIVAEPDLLALLLPTLRADIAALEAFRPGRRDPLPVPLMAMGGVDDRLVPRAHIAAWHAETMAEFDQRMFPGGHFYLDTNRAAVVGDIARRLTVAVDNLREPAR